MGDLQTARYDQLLRRVGGQLGGGSFVTEALSELFPVLDVENTPVELKFLTGWRLGMGTLSNAAVAANNLLMQLFNPANSGQIMVPTRIDISSGTAQPIRYVSTNIALTAVSLLSEQRDTRVGATERTVGQIRSSAQVGAAGEVAQFLIEADVNFTLEDQDGVFVLAPGTGCTFSTTIINSSLRFSVLWRERQALSSELNFP